MKDKNIQNQKNSSNVKSGPFSGGPGHSMANIQKARDFKATMKILLKYLSPYKIAITFVVIFAIASTIFTILSPKLLGDMTNQIVSDFTKIKIYNQQISLPSENVFPTPPTINYTKLSQIGLILICLYLLGSLFAYIQGWIMASVTQKITYKLRKNISKKINLLPLKYFDQKSYGDTLSRVINDVDTVSQSLNQSLTQIVTAITTIVGILIMMFVINWMMTLVSLLMLPLSFGIIGKIIKFSQKHFKRQQNSLGQINGHIEEMYSGHSVMKVFNGEESSLKKFQTINNKMYDSAWKAQFYSGLMWPIMNFVGNLGFVGVSVLGGWLALRGSIRIGDIQAFIQYMRQFNQPVMQTANIANVLQSTAAAAERVFEFLDEEEEKKENVNCLTIKKPLGKVEFNNVSFSYNSDNPIIKNLNINIKSGQRVAIVGPTGAGKTTIVNLLMRFYDINEGSIKIDGVDIKDMKRSNLRKMFGMVLQDSWLFNGTIKQNIAYGNTTASDEDIIKTAKAAHADQIIQTLPDGYDMIINEQTDNISQGEKQLITIARAMLINPTILILDEATSSVDTRTEVLIQKAMDILMKGKTSFVIAHRLSTIKDADLILVMQEGELVEQGTHKTLLNKKGFYASLYYSQFTTKNSSQINT